MTSSNFDFIYGNEKVKEYLKRSLKTGSVGNSYLFSGLPGIGKSLFAKALGSELIGNSERVLSGGHPDFHELRPEGKVAMHSMSALRNFQQQVNLAPQEGEWKIFVIHDAERMLPTSSNALLKIFEEPPENTVIILLSSSPQKILPTIISRCRRVCFQPLSTSEVSTLLETRKLPTEHAEHAGGSISEALKLATSENNALLEFLASDSRNYLSIQRICKTLAEQLDSAKKEIEIEARNELALLSDEQLTAKLREQIEKQVAGYIALKAQEEVDRIFKTIFAWYRDRALLKVGGDKSLLYFPSYDQPGRLLSLVRVDLALKSARQEVERFGSFSHSLETCFLSLN